MPDAALLVRADGIIADLNQYAEALFGYRREELVGQNLDALIPERFRQGHARHSARYIHEPRPRAMGSGMDLWGLRKDGSEFPVDISLSPRQTPEGTHIVCSIRDLSARLLHTVGEQLAFEKLIIDISARFARMPIENVDEEIVRSLQQVVEFLGLDRSSLGEFSSEEGLLVVSHSYALPGFDPVPRVNLDQQFPWYATRLRRGDIVRCERLPEDLPPEAEKEREYITATGFKAILTIPIGMAGAVAYVLSVGSFRSYRKWPDELVQRLRLLGEMFAGALARSRAQQALEEQLAFERLVTDISARFANLQLKDVDAEITRGLRRIAEFLDVDRNGFGEFSNEQGTLTTTHFYAVPGMAPPPPQVLHAQFPWYTSRVRRGEIQRYQSLPEGLPPEAEAEKEYVIATGMRAHLSVPIKVRGGVAYILNVDSHRSPRQWPDKVVQRLQLLGEIFAGALTGKRSREALQESEAKFRLLAETATCAIGIYQGDRFLYINPRATDITGYSADELLSQSVEELIHPDFRALVPERAQARLRGDRVPARYELKIVTKQGEERWVDFAASMTHYQGRPAIIGTAFDVTERKKAEESLHELGGRLIQAQEDERTRIARELHDDLSQRLALLSMGLEEAGHQTAPSAPALQEHLQALGAQTREIGTDIHRLSRQLHPSQLEVLGLVPALRGYCADLSKQKGLPIDFRHEGTPQELPPEVSLCLYRIVQEGLHNTCKHSGAGWARVTLGGDAGAVHLTVTDNGRGFDPALLGAAAGLGLVSMRERARFAHGELAVYSQPGAGTRLEVHIPLKESSA